MNPLGDVLFSSDLWKIALEKYAEATHLTIKLFDADERVVFGPIHPTPLFQLFDERGYDPGIFADCAHRCLAQSPTHTNGRPSVLVSQAHGLAVLGTSLVLDNELVGAAVGGYAIADFSQVSEIQRLAREAGIGFDQVWQVAREQPPVPQRRLTVHGELLQVLGDALLRENYRTRQNAEARTELAAELADTQLLQETSGRLIQNGDIAQLYDQILDAATGIMRSDMASIQMFDDDQGALRLLASRGFGSAFVQTFERVGPETKTSCSMAARAGHRVVVPDVETCDFIVGTAALEDHRKTGIRAVQSTPLVSRNGRLLGMISTHWRTPHRPAEREFRLLDVLARQAADLIERKRAEAALCESEERYRALFELGPVAVYSIDTSGVIQNFNGRAVELWGRTPASGDTDQRFCGSYKLFRPDGSFMPHEQCPMAEVVSGKIPAAHNAEVHIGRPDGSRVTVLVNIRPLKNELGEITGAINCFYDITERKRAEEERERLLAGEHEAREQAEAANRAKDDFLAVVSHELRTPLSPVLMWTRMLKSGSDPSQIPRAMEMIERNVLLQLRIIEDLLDLSRITKDKMKLELAEHDLSLILHWAVDGIREDAEMKGITLELAGTGDPPRVRADAGRLQQVFANILSNALKFTPPGGGIQVRFAAEGKNAVVRFRDTGKGISQEFLPHVFEIFRQQEGGTRRAHTGLGIGLALVKSLVEAHGGDVKVKSEGLGFGTEITLTLPRLKAIPESATYNLPSSLRLSSALQGRSILLVEDSDDSREAMELMLKTLGAQVSSARDGRQALNVIAAAEPDFILCDLAMPRMDGFEFIERLRHVRGSGHPPVIAVSGLTTDADHERTRAAGFAGHLNKPFDDISLVSAITTAVRA
jgi:signal transduction histidine kinase/ActR/RegA family two-component response regulator